MTNFGCYLFANRIANRLCNMNEFDLHHIYIKCITKDEKNKILTISFDFIYYDNFKVFVFIDNFEKRYFARSSTNGFISGELKQFI